MRLISLVPSITETLIMADANVIGRSRFCIHPHRYAADIPKVGGTKEIDWQAVEPLLPNLVILDREENTREMAESCPYPYLDLHITDVTHVAHELERLANAIHSPPLSSMARRWNAQAAQNRSFSDLQYFPALVEWWREPTNQTKVEYLIWKDPWMAIGPDTFIHSMLDHLGAGRYLQDHDEKYPTIDINQLDPAETVLLFSTEPYPFARYKDELTELGFSCGLIEAEHTSWYGLRSLQFLESL